MSVEAIPSAPAWSVRVQAEAGTQSARCRSDSRKTPTSRASCHGARGRVAPAPNRVRPRPCRRWRAGRRTRRRAAPCPRPTRRQDHTTLASPRSVASFSRPCRGRTSGERRSPSGGSAIARRANVHRRDCRLSLRRAPVSGLRLAARERHSLGEFLRGLRPSRRSGLAQVSRSGATSAANCRTRSSSPGLW